MSPWEALAAALAIAYLLLAARERIACWGCALVITAIYTVLFWNVSLLMESALNVYYLLMAIYGWYQWRRGGRDGASLASSDSDWRAAVTMSPPQSKVTETSAEPRLVCERILRTPGTARSASSTGRAGSNSPSDTARQSFLPDPSPSGSSPRSPRRLRRSSGSSRSQ